MGSVTSNGVEVDADLHFDRELKLDPNHDASGRVRYDRMVFDGRNLKILKGIPGDGLPKIPDGWESHALIEVKPDTQSVIAEYDPTNGKVRKCAKWFVVPNRILELPDDSPGKTAVMEALSATFQALLAAEGLQSAAEVTEAIRFFAVEEGGRISLPIRMDEFDFLTTPAPKGTGFMSSPTWVPVLQPIAEGRTLAD